MLVTGGEDLSGIPTGEVDLAMSVSSFHHLADPRKALVELRRVVRPGGRVYVRDMKSGRLFKHGSRSDQFRAAVSGEFPNAEFEEGSGLHRRRGRALKGLRASGPCLSPCRLSRRSRGTPG